LIFILAGVLVVMIESVNSIQARFASFFLYLEWIFTIVFTIEYILRLYSVYRPMKYALSVWGIIDLLAVLPTYLSFILPGAQYFLVVRVLRLMRVFRIFKLAKFLKESSVIINALKASREKITVFMTFVLLSVTIIGAIMYLVEGGSNDSFSSIPRSIYWAIVTLTTVGYGDISPATSLGQFFAAVVMIMGYAVIAVPTGIVSAELVASARADRHTTQVCRYCARAGHEHDALFCKYCGGQLNNMMK